MREVTFSAVIEGKIWTDEEEVDAKYKNKKLAKYNLFRPSARMIEGYFRDLKLDVAYTPVGDSPKDGEFVEALEALRIQEANVNDDVEKDTRTVLEAWAGRSGWQEIWVDSGPGMPARTRSANRDPFSVFPDPRSRIPITRDDAEFIDVVDWMRPDQLLVAAPSKREEIRSLLESREDTYGVDKSSANTFEQAEIYKDRDYENKNYKDGRYKVVCRYYKVMSQKMEYWDTDNMEWVVVDTPDDAPVSANFRATHKDELWWIMAVPGLSRSEIFVNEKYYLQLRHPRTGMVMFPFIEMVAEELNGKVTSFAEHDMEPIRSFNAMVTNVNHSAKHAASQAMLQDDSAFKNDREAKAAAQHHSDSDQVFKVKSGRLNDAMKPIEHGSVTNDTYRAMEIAKSVFDELSSTPPAMAGMREGNESGILHSQRVEQSQLQLRGLGAHYTNFVNRRYLIRYLIWREYYTEEQIIQIADPTDEQRDQGREQVVLNQRVDPQLGPGYQLVYRLKNDLNAVLYDITTKVSKRSPTERMKTLSQLAELSQTPAAAADPGIAVWAFLASADLMDLPQKYQDEVRQYSKLVQENMQREQQQKQAQSESAQQMAQAQAQSQMQEIQSKAQKTGMEAAKLEQEIAQARQDLTSEVTFDALDARLKELDIKLKEIQIQQERQGLVSTVEADASRELVQELATPY